MTSAEQSGEFPRLDSEPVRGASSRKTGVGGGAGGAGESSEAALEIDEHFGVRLRRAREDKGLTLAYVAERIKVSRTTLTALEAGRLAELPAPVYVRGFIRSYARAIGLAETEPVLLFDRAIEARDAAEQAKAAIPVPTEEEAREAEARGTHPLDDGAGARRGVGLAVFVIILLLIATITLSFFLRRPPSSGEGLSLGEDAPRGALALSSAPKSDFPLTKRG